MNENRTYSDEIDLRALFSILWHGKYFIIFSIILFIGIGSVYLRNLDSKYEVSVLLAAVQEEQTSPNFGNLSGLASLAGVSLPTGRASDFGKYKMMLKTQEVDNST